MKSCFECKASPVRQKFCSPQCRSAARARKRRNEGYWRTETCRVRSREFQQRARKAVITLLGGCCVRCGFSDYRALQIDHVRGGGLQELKQFSGARYYKHVMKSVLAGNSTYQLLCANCNWIKRAENGEQPGRPRR